MKTLTLTFLIALSVTNVFAKGGDFPPIRDRQIPDRLQAYRQIYVSIGIIESTSDYLKSREDLVVYMSNLKLKYPVEIKRTNGPYATSFCLSLKNQRQKGTLTQEISQELKLIPASVATSINSNLVKPCK